MAQTHSSQIIAEMQEFASFDACEQRYIRRSLDVLRKGVDAEERWSRDTDETASIRAQARLYRTLAPAIRSTVPDDIAVEVATEFLAALTTLSAFDLGEGKLLSFAAYRFLYERLLGGSVRPWLPSAYVAAATLPCLHPELRKDLLSSISAGEAAANGWSSRETLFDPEWVEKVPAPVS
jgi:hypothetical protein